MSASDSNFSLKLDVQLPLGSTSPMSRPQIAPHALTQPISPQPNQQKPVRQGSPFNTICAQVGAPDAPFQMWALVYPAITFPLPNPGDHLPGGAVPGTASQGNTVWTWDSNNEIPAAVHSCNGGTANVLAVWKQLRPDGTPVFDLAVPFFGVTGTTAPCGSGPSPCGSGSGSGSTALETVTIAGIYPRVWVLRPAGPVPTSFASFQAASALVWVEHTQDPTWHNGGDGVHAISITLVHQPKKSQWQITLMLDKVKIVDTAPCTGARFGPLVFPATKHKPARGEAIEVPALEACAY
jgi:hypothetical protein